jgi:hypothetical protein
MSPAPSFHFVTDTEEHNSFSIQDAIPLFVALFSLLSSAAVRDVQVQFSEGGLLRGLSNMTAYKKGGPSTCLHPNFPF